MTLTSIVRYEKEGNVTHITNDCYNNKKEMKEELKSNGIIVLAVYKEKDIKAIKEMKSYELNTIEKQYAWELL